MDPRKKALTQEKKCNTQENNFDSQEKRFNLLEQKSDPQKNFQIPIRKYFQCTRKNMTHAGIDPGKGANMKPTIFSGLPNGEVKQEFSKTMEELFRALTF